MGLQGFPRVQRDSIVAVPRQAAPTALEDNTKAPLPSLAATDATVVTTAQKELQARANALEGE